MSFNMIEFVLISSTISVIKEKSVSIEESLILETR